MAMNDKEVRLIPSGQEGSAQRASDAPHVLYRSAVNGGEQVSADCRLTTAFERKSWPAVSHMIN